MLISHPISGRKERSRKRRRIINPKPAQKMYTAKRLFLLLADLKSKERNWGPSTQMIEEPVELRDVKIYLRSDGRAPEKVYLAPCGTSLPFEIIDGYIEISIPAIKGYSLIVFGG